MYEPTLELEQTLLDRGHRLVAGVDEVGRGSWAGPVVAAAVILPLADLEALTQLREVRDSKLLTRPQREELYEVVRRVALAVGVGWAPHTTVDEIGIARANVAAMVEAVAALPLRPDALLIDYVRLGACDLPQISLPGGDRRSLSIASASIVAKVTRDRWMQGVDADFPQYGFARNMGYGTPEHRRAVREHGPCPLHRRSFRPLSEYQA